MGYRCTSNACDRDWKHGTDEKPSPSKKDKGREPVKDKKNITKYQECNIGRKEARDTTVTPVKVWTRKKKKE